jgi:hypothetical protein
MPLSFIDAHKEWRNRARGYSLRSVADCALSILHEDAPTRIAELQKAPWQLLLLIKWTFQDDFNKVDTGAQISRKQMDDLRQELWGLSGRFEGGISANKPASLFLRQLLRQQIDFQKEVTLGFMREAVLLGKQPLNSRLRVIFREITGLEVEDFEDLSIALYAAILDKKKSVGINWFSPLRVAYGDKVDLFLSLVSRDIYGLVEYFRSVPGARAKVASEYFEFPIISRHPFLRINDDLIVWHPAIFYRGMENLVHALMSERGQSYLAEFTRLFERHVVQESRSVPCQFHDEADLLQWLPNGSKVVDGLMSFDGFNVFVEAKAGMFDESVKVAGNSQIFTSKTEMLRKAMLQARSVSSGLRIAASAPRRVIEAEIEFLLVVTNKEIGVGRGDRLLEMCGCELPEDEIQGRLPLNHVYFLSIEDYERLLAGLRSGTSDLPSLMTRCVERDSSAESSLFYFSQHLDAERFQRKTSAAIDDALEQANQRLARNLGQDIVPITQ